MLKTILCFHLLIVFNRVNGKDIFENVFKDVEKSVVSLVFENCTELQKNLLNSDRNNIPDTSHLKLDLMLETDKESYILNTVPTKLKASGNFNESLPIVIYMHGFLSNTERKGTRTVTSALISHGGYNVLALNSESLITISYILSSKNTYFIGVELGKVLARLTEDGIVAAEDIYLVGHSLGAHIAGFTGKTYEMLTGNKIGRITGLDPAGPCFFLEHSDNRLTKDDAEFVDVIHTNKGVNGYIHPMGHVDFFPNGGRHQPGCKDSPCSHCVVWNYFAESVTNPKIFPALQCDNWTKFQAKQCENNDVEYMGFGTDFGARGTYYLRTSGTMPFGKGVRGIHI